MVILSKNELYSIIFFLNAMIEHVVTGYWTLKHPKQKQMDLKMA